MFYRRRSVHWLIITSLCLFAAPVFSDQPQDPSSNQYQGSGKIQHKQIELTEGEKAFLQSHPVIRLGTDEGWEPFLSRGTDGILRGVDVDFIRYINESTGSNIQLVTGRWKDMEEKAKNREIDGLVTSAPLKAREPFFKFSDVYLPASAKKIIEEKQPSGDILRGSETVLFVDDEDMIIEIAGELFKELGYKILIARGGKEAIEIYEKNKDLVDVVILDMIMPDMSGSVTYDRLKEIDPHIKVLLSSGYSINGQATEIMDRGCDGFIQKPFKVKALSQKLRNILDNFKEE